MRSPRADALTLISDLRTHLQEESLFLASSEDAAYFRKLFKPSPPPPISSPSPSPCPIPAPVISNPIPTPTTSSPSPIPPSLPSPRPTSSLKSIFAKIAPELPLLEEIPSDGFAKKLSTRWKTKNQIAPILLLSFQEPAAHKSFLKEIAQALDVYFGPAKMISAEAIEREKTWDIFLSAPELKWIFLCDYTLWQLHSLLPFYREVQGVRTLKEIPLFLLPDLSLYLKDPQLKRSLWKALCEKLST